MTGLDVLARGTSSGPGTEQVVSIGPGSSRGGGSPPAGPDAAAVKPSEPLPPDVVVVKSGVVDGMAYSLYSDGSIEAQMPEGMMRFASIDELRTHLDQRS